jgi:hypothetical protein
MKQRLTLYERYLYMRTRLFDWAIERCLLGKIDVDVVHICDAEMRFSIQIH